MGDAPSVEGLVLGLVLLGSGGEPLGRSRGNIRIPALPITFTASHEVNRLLLPLAAPQAQKPQGQAPMD